MQDIDFRINRSNKIYPIFSGMSADLLFWVAINTIFLTTVKKFTAAQISSLTTIGILFSILFYPFIFKIIKKIGNINSIKLGTLLLLTSAILITFSKSYYLILLGHIIYDIAFLFKNMENVVLRKNLKYQNKVDEYLKIQGKSSFIYSFITMIIAFISGFLFNINNYLPMILCILFCALDFILSNFLYECNLEEERVEAKNKNKFKFTNIIFLILLLYGFVYATIDLGQSNNKLFMQYKLSTYLELDKVALVLSFIVTISRAVRVISNFIFTKFLSKKKNILTTIGYCLMLAFICIIIGSTLKTKQLGIIFMSLGFFTFLAVRDPFANYMKTLLLNNCDENMHENAITYLTLSRKIGKFLVSSVITLILLKVDMIYVMFILLLISIIDIFIIKKIYNLCKN